MKFAWLLSALALAITQSVTGQLSSDPNPDDVEVLLRLKQEWGASFFGADTWDTNGTWDGVAVDWSNAVTSIELPASGVSGSLSSTLAGLQALSTLDLRSNNLTGTLSGSVFRSIPTLENLYLADNKLSGPIPPELLTLPSLVTLDLSTNQLAGGIPSTIPQATALTSLDLAQNALTGSIPGSIISCKRLAWLWLGQNKLSGSIPVNLWRLRGLQVLDLSFNQLIGGIPNGLGTFPGIAILALNNNKLMGSVPPSFSSLSASLVTLSLANNYLTGPLPSFPTLVQGCQGYDLSCYILQTQIDLSNNFFYGPPTLTIQLPQGASAPPKVTKICPEVDYPGQLVVTGNCLDANATLGSGSSCTGGEQRSAAECVAFCGTGLPGGQCNGHGTCWPWAYPHKPQYGCHCDSGYKPKRSNPGNCTKA